MSKKNSHKKIIATSSIIIIALVLLIEALPYLSAFIGAIIFYALLNPIQQGLEKKMGKKKAAALSIVIGSLIILIPVSIAITLTAGEVGSVLSSSQQLIQSAKTLDEKIPFLQLSSQIDSLVKNLVLYLQTILFSAIGSITNTLINLLIMYFVLYYLLINRERIPHILEETIPFNQKNSQQLVNEFYNITHSVVVTTGIISLVQGGMLALGFAVFGINNPLFWGFMTAVLSFLPVVGPTLIWVPAGIIELAQGNIGIGIGVLIWGFILSNIDNFIRPYLQQRKGKIHPLISLIGVFLGLPLFGILGLVMGPLLLSYFFLMMKMFKEEYL